MARYYVLSIEPSLFGDAALIREWGRIGRTGQRRVELYENQPVRSKPSRPGSSESGDAATSCEAGRGRSPGNSGFVSAQDLEQFFDSFSFFEAASLVLAQHVPDLGAL